MSNKKTLHEQCADDYRTAQANRDKSAGAKREQTGQARANGNASGGTWRRSS